MRVNGETVAFGDRPLKLLDGRFFELDDGAAGCANQVIMVGCAVRQLVAREIVPEVEFIGEPTFGQHLQRAVDRCVADSGVALLDQGQEVFDGQVAPGVDEGIDNDPALFGRAQALAGHVGVEVDEQLCRSRTLA